MVELLGLYKDVEIYLKGVYTKKTDLITVSQSSMSVEVLRNAIELLTIHLKMLTFC